MKITAFLASVCLSSSIWASGVIVPTGSLVLESSEVTYGKDIRLVFRDSNSGRAEVSNLRQQGYACANTATRFVRCSKFLSIDHDLLQGLNKYEEELDAISPTFATNYKVEVLNDSGDPMVYRVEQLVTSRLGTAKEYKMYVRSNGTTDLDIIFDGQAYRFKTDDYNNFTAVLFKANTFNRFHFVEYGSEGAYQSID